MNRPGGHTERKGSARELLTRLAIPDGIVLNACPACGSAPELWEARARNDIGADIRVVKYVCCPNMAYGSSDGVTEESIQDVCPFYEPPGSFFCSTKREAIEFWNRATGRKIPCGPTPLTDDKTDLQVPK